LKKQLLLFTKQVVKFYILFSPDWNLKTNLNTPKTMILSYKTPQNILQKGIKMCQKFYSPPKIGMFLYGCLLSCSCSGFSDYPNYSLLEQRFKE